MEIKYKNHYLNDLDIANFARASLDKAHEEFNEGDERLIKFLARNKHWTPFGHSQVTLHFTVPIFIDRQLVRHTIGFVRSEVSRRYVDYVPTFYTTDKLGKRAENKKQGTVEGEFITTIDDYSIYGDHSPTLVNEFLQCIYDSALEDYQHLLNMEVAPEDARMVLPLAMETSYYLTGSLYAYFRMYSLRIQKNAQRQSQEIAQMIDSVIQPLFPVSWLALKETIIDN